MLKTLIFFTIVANFVLLVSSGAICAINEVYKDCPVICSPGTCDTIGKSYSCPNIVKCNASCVCKPNYYKNKLGQCISADECTTCKGPNEVYDLCPDTCPPQTCESIGKIYHCPLLSNKTDSCKPACRCLPGYLRNKDGQCISESDCPSVCKQHEISSDCINGGCNARNCSQLGRPVPCVKPKICIKGCICDTGYLRASNGTCIPEDKCPSCGGDPNAKPGCGINCGRLCSNYNKGPVACPKICKVNACDCKDKYVYDENKKKCVLPVNCSPTTTSSTTTTTEAPQEENTALERLQIGNVAFTLNFLYQMITQNAGSSVVMSPFSVLIPLAQLALYTSPGDSYNQLMGVLNLNDKDEIRSVFPELLTLLKSQTEAILDMGAKIYVNKDYELTDNFQKDTKDVFDAEAENIDFGNPQQAADIINAWVEEITRGLIKNLVSPSMFSSLTRLVLTNAIYFLGNWQKQFNPNDTKTDDFYLSDDKTVDVPMMFLEGTFKYADSSDLDSQILEIPYKGGNFSYVIFVPRQNNGYSSVAEKIRDTEVLYKALDLMNYEKCLLYLPRHEITSSVDLVDILSKSNVTDIFDDSKSNLSGIFKNNKRLGVSAAIQKAFIKVDETGTEAAAANAIVVGTTAVGVPVTIYTVKANKPFIFFLFLNRKPLFCGAYAGNP